MTDKEMIISILVDNFITTKEKTIDITNQILIGLEQSHKADVDELVERLEQTNEVLQIHANLFGNSDTATEQMELNNKIFSKHHKSCTHESSTLDENAGVWVCDDCNEVTP